MTSIFNLVLPLVLVRILPTEDVGRYKIFFLYLGLVPWFFLTAGVNNGLSHWAGRRDFGDRAIRASWTLLMLFSLVILVAGALSVNRLSDALGWPIADVQVFLWGAFFTILAQFFEEASIARGEIWRGAFFNSGFEFTKNVSILALALLTRDVRMVFVGYAITMTLKVGLGIVLGYRASFQRLSFDFDAWGKVLRYAIPVSFAAALQILTSYADQLVLSRFIPSAEFAIYSLGCLVIPPLLIFEQSVNRVLIPELSACFQNGDASRAKRFYKDAVLELGWFLIPSVAGLFVFAEPIVRFLFTEKFIDSVPFLKLYAFSYLAYMMPFDAVPRAKGDGRWILGNLAFFSVLSLVASMTLVRELGAIGTLGGMIFIQYAMRLNALRQVRTREKWRFSEFLPVSGLARFAGLSMVFSALALAMKPLFESPLAWFAVGGSLFFVGYMAVTLPERLRARNLRQATPKVLILTQYLGIGGLERMIYNLCKGMARMGRYRPVVFVYEHGEGEDTLLPLFQQARFEVVPFRKKEGFSFAAVGKMVRLLWKERIPLIHSHDLNALIYAVIAKTLLLGSVKVVHTQHSFVHLGRNRRQFWYERFFTFFADEIIIVSEDLGRKYKEIGIWADELKLIPNGVEFPEQVPAGESEWRALRSRLVSEVSDANARESLQVELDSIWVLCMARVHPGKGQDHVLKLWERLPSEVRSKGILLFVGQESFPGALDTLRKAMLELQKRLPAGEVPRMVYLGATLKPRDWLMASDVFVSGSEFEGMPLGPIEAIGSGIPVLVSEIAGHEILRGMAEFFGLADPDAGSRRLARLMSLAQASDSGELSAMAPPARLGLRRKRWEGSSEWRGRFGILGMTQAYEDSYEKAQR